MNEQRFRTLELRALYEIGAPTAALWLLWLGQLLLGRLRLHFSFVGLDLCRYAGFVAFGFTLVWLLAWQWTQTEVVVAPKGISLRVFGRQLWHLPWEKLVCWSWWWHWTGVPEGIQLIGKDGLPRQLRLGFLGLGRSVRGTVQVFPYYVPLLKALGYYLPGETWHEPPMPTIKISRRML